jgi:putative DNA primase/helicase
MFDVKCPKALAAIGKLPGTSADRSIVVNMRRKLKEEKVAPLRKTPLEIFQALKRKMMRWALDNAHLVKTYVDDDSILPSGMNDREDLLAIAKAAGGDWLKEAQAAAKSLSGDAAEDDHNVTTVSLKALRNAFKESFEEDEPENGDRDLFLSTHQLLETFNSDKEAQWADWNNKNGLTEEKLSSMLRPFKVRSRQKQVLKERARGYLFKDL